MFNIKKRSITRSAKRNINNFSCHCSFSNDLLHDIIFLFHMPLFFIILGYLIKDSYYLNSEYIKKLILRFFYHILVI